MDESRRGPSHSCRDEARAPQIMDATFRLPDGRVVSKYDYCHDVTDDDYHVYGWAAADGGAWLIQPSAEYYPTTPFKQFLTAHQTARSPIIIWQAHCVHFGGQRVICRAGETWRKLYGPAFVYVNGAAGEAAAWADAKRQAAALQGQWPYRWMSHELFARERGRVSGRIVLADGRAAANAWVILSPPGVGWAAEVKGYHFWARTDERGGFAVDNVRPGTYDLAATGADQFEEFAAGPIAVEAGKTAAAGVLRWKPAVHGRRVWQIGTADRSPGEFRNGDDYRHWGVWRRYPRQFPGGVCFRVGASRERTDWNFAHWSWHTGRADWRIEFDMDAAAAGRAQLTIGVAAARPAGRARTTDVRVGVNGREIGAIRLASSGGCGYRSGRQTTPYSVVALTFDAALLAKGRNTVSLEHAGSVAYGAGDAMGEAGSGPGYLMYDAIRLEVDGSGPGE